MQIHNCIMLLFQLIPYFLAARVDNDIENWINGPEYNFSGHLKMITFLDIDKGVNHGTVVNLSLICRPKEPDVLRCQLENTMINRIKPQGSDNYQFKNDDYNNYRNINLINVPFEINFNKNGIRHYTFDKSDNKNLSMWIINMARLIGNQLNFGNDFSDEMRRKFRGYENFTVGECEVNFYITRQPYDDLAVNLFNKFTLMPLDKLGEYNNEIISILKNRNLKNCLKYGEPFFGTRYTLGLILRDVQTILKTSKSKIKTSIHEFTSETINESDIYGDDKKLQGTVSDQMDLKLISIVPAKNKLLEFKNPIKYGVLSEKLEPGESQY